MARWFERGDEVRRSPTQRPVQIVTITSIAFGAVAGSVFDLPDPIRALAGASKPPLFR